MSLSNNYIKYFNFNQFLVIFNPAISHIIQQYMEKKQPDTVEKLLDALCIKSIDELLQTDTIDVKKICDNSQLHEFIVEEYLHKLQHLLNNPTILQNPTEFVLKLEQIFPQYSEDQNNKPLKLQINSSEIVEVIGRANSGKSYTMVRIAEHCLKNKIRVIMLYSPNTNIEAIKKKLSGKIGGDLIQEYFKKFEFRNIAELAMLLHTIGEYIITSRKKISQSESEYPYYPTIVLIDCLSRIQHNEQPVQYDMTQKFKRLLLSFVNRCTTVIYTYRVNASLFDNAYKKQQTRPKIRNTKEYDSIASKSIFLDYVEVGKSSDMISRVVRINLIKSIDSKMHQFIVEEKK